MLGVYVSDHPLSGLTRQLKNQTDASIAKLREMREGDVKWIGGIIADEQKKMTKKGDTMVVLQLEDLEASAEVVVFPQVYQAAYETIKKDNIVLVRGRIDSTGRNGRMSDAEGQIKMVAMEIKPLDKRGDAARSVTVFLNMDSLNDKLLADLKTILTSHAGPNPVTLKVTGKNTETVLELGQGFKVKPSGGLFAEVKALLGAGSIRE